LPIEVSALSGKGFVLKSGQHPPTTGRKNQAKNQQYGSRPRITLASGRKAGCTRRLVDTQFVQENQEVIMTDIREYTVRADSTEIFGRVLCSARNHHFVVDGPVQNGCPGEAITPAEIFLSGVAACGVELVQVLAKGQNVPLRSIHVSVWGMMDRSKPVRSDVNVFNSVKVEFQLKGVTRDQGAVLIEAFKAR
jgi:uncharacterized OsmC-like protein